LRILKHLAIPGLQKRARLLNHRRCEPFLGSGDCAAGDVAR
jgi:hypothetical protein